MTPLPTGGALLFGGMTPTGINPFTYTLSGSTWTAQYPPVSPVGRTDHSLMLDPVRQENILFGGKNPVGTSLGGTWKWAQDEWTLLSTPVAPSARSGHQMIFDRVANVGLLFGGENPAGTALNDFWSWNGTTWTQLQPAALPPARARHGMAFDGLRNRTVVHGGKSGATRLSDVWEWDGSTWTEASASIRPPERHGQALVRDTARNRMVLFGGRNNGGFFSDTWEFANSSSAYNPGISWSRVTTQSSPTTRNGHAMAYDPARNKTVLFGGYDGTNALGQTWSYDGTNWTQLTPATLPSARNAASMAFDAGRGVAVMFGGSFSNQPLLNETWEWNGVDWTLRTTATTPPARMYAPMAYDAARQRIVMFGGLSTTNTFLEDTWVFDGTNWTLAASTGPSARDLSQMCYDPARGETILFGGRTSSGASSETWAWNGTAWTQRAPVNNPTARQQGSMAFDATRNKVLLFGGASTNWLINYSDTWEWDGTTWQPSVLRRGDGIWNPGGIERHAMAYDPRSERVVAFGGDTAAGCSPDLWTWDGGEWTLHYSPTNVAPSARSGAQMVHDSTNNKLLLLAGGCGSSSTNDLWDLRMPTFSRTEAYGSPCVGSAGPLTLGVFQASKPIIGQTFQMRITNVPTFAPCFGLLGFSNTTLNGVPLPVALDALRLYGCFAYMSKDLNFTLPAVNNVTRTVEWNLPLPNDTAFLGVHIYMQGLALEFGGIRFGTVTNGLDARIGDN